MDDLRGLFHSTAKPNEIRKPERAEMRIHDKPKSTRACFRRSGNRESTGLWTIGAPSKNPDPFAGALRDREFDPVYLGLPEFPNRHESEQARSQGKPYWD